MISRRRSRARLSITTTVDHCRAAAAAVRSAVHNRSRPRRCQQRYLLNYKSSSADASPGSGREVRYGSRSGAGVDDARGRWRRRRSAGPGGNALGKFVGPGDTPTTNSSRQVGRRVCLSDRRDTRCDLGGCDRLSTPLTAPSSVSNTPPTATGALPNAARCLVDCAQSSALRVLPRCAGDIVLRRRVNR